MRYVERVERIMTTLLTQNELELDIPIRDADLESAYDRAEQIVEYAERRERFGARSTEQPDPSWLQIMKQRCRAADEYAQSRDCTLP